MFAHQKAQRLDEQGLAPFALGIPGARLSLHGLDAESIAFDKQTTLFDLTLMTARDGDRLSVALEYSTDLFKSSTIDRMADGFRNLLEAIVADPGAGSRIFRCSRARSGIYCSATGRSPRQFLMRTSPSIIASRDKSSSRPTRSH